MADKIHVKICGMRDPENIRKVAGLKPDYLGFILYPPSKRFLGENYILDSPVPEGILKVGVFVNALITEVVHWVNRLDLDFVQLHGEESPEYCYELQLIGIPVIKSFGIEADFDFRYTKPWLPVADYFLFDTKTPERGGSGKQFNWEQLKEYTYDKAFFLSGGIGPDDARSIKKIKGLPLHAVDINSRFEDSPALKNIDLVKKFIRDLN
jgi:phosphoribosylanthranilate isomerase